VSDARPSGLEGIVSVQTLNIITAMLTLYPEVTTEEGLLEIHILDFNRNLVLLPIGLLRSNELAPRT
jgi:hypothetical protein